MSTATTSRTDLVAALMVILNAYKAANPTLMTACYTALPENVGDVPCAYLGERRENISMDLAQFDRALRVEVCLVDAITGNAAVMGRMDVLVDGVLSILQANLRAITNGPPLTVVDINPDELDINGVIFRRETILVSARWPRGAGL